MAKKNNAHVFDFTGILNAEINQQNWKEKKRLLQEQFGEFKIALETDLAEAEAQKILDMFNEKLNIQLNVEQVKKDAEAVKKIIETALASINNIDTSALRGIEDTLKGIAETTSGIFDKLSENTQKASKKTIASVTAIDTALQKLGGDFTDVQEALDFEIKGGAEKQLEAVRKEQERLNEALKGDDWVEKQKALVRYTKAFESYQAKVKNNANKIPKELSDLYHANVGRASDAKINLQHIIDRHDQKWSGETSGGSVNVDTSKLATEDTLKTISNKLDNLKVNVSGDKSDGNKPSKPQKVSKDSFEKQIAKNFLKDYDVVFDKYGDTSELEVKIDELISRVVSSLQIKDGFDLKSTLNDATLEGWSASELAEVLKGNIFEQTNTQPTAQDGTTVGIDETALANSIANALKGVQLNANTQDEVKASIDATELKGVLHDGTPYDVRIVGDDGTDKPATETTLGAIKGVLDNINTSLQADNSDPEIVNRLDQIVTNTSNLPTSIKEALYAGEMANAGYSEITDADFDKIFYTYVDNWVDDLTMETFPTREEAEKVFTNEYKGKFAKRDFHGRIAGDLYSKDDLLNNMAQGRLSVEDSDNHELVNIGQSIVQIITDKGNEIVEAIKILVSGEAIDTNVDYKALLDTLVSEFKQANLDPRSGSDWTDIQYGVIQLTDGLKDVLHKLTLLNADGKPNFKLARNGSFAQAAVIGDENAVIAREAMSNWKSGLLESPEKLIPLMQKASEEGAKIARVLGFIKHKDSLIELQEKAPGQNAQYDTLEKWAHATTGQIKELINTVLVMIKNGVYPELRGSNLMYDKDKGFTFIDMFDEESAKTFYQDVDISDPTHIIQKLVDYLIRHLNGGIYNTDTAQAGYEFSSKFAETLKTFKLPQSLATGMLDAVREDMRAQGITPQPYYESEEDKKMPERKRKQQEQGRGGLATEQTLSSIKAILEGMSKEPEQDTEINLASNSIQAIIDGIKVIMPQTDTNAPWATEDTLTNGTNKKLEDIKNTLKGMVMMPKPQDDAEQPTGAVDVEALLEGLAVSDDGFSPGKASITYDADGNPVYGKRQRKRKTGQAVQTLKEGFKYNEDGEPELTSYEVTDDIDKLIAEQNKLKEKQASMLKELAQFDNKALGLGDLFEGYDKLEALLKSENFGDEELQQAKLLLEQLNQEYNELTKMARKGSPSLNPFVNMVNGKDKLENTIRGIQLSFQSLQEQPPELKAKIDKLLVSFAEWSNIKFDGTEQENAERLKLMAEKYGEIKTQVNSLKSEISNTNKEQKLHQKAVKALLDDYRKLGELDVQKELATGDERAAIEKEIRGTQMLLGKRRVALGVDKTEADATRAEAMNARNEEIRVANVTKLLKLTKELGEQEARIVKFKEGSQQAQDAQTNIDRLQKEITNIREKCELTEEELILLAELEDANKRLLATAQAKQGDKEDKKSLNERIKAERKAARINASNTNWNAGQRTLESLWKLDDDDINVNQIPAVKQLDAALEDLAAAQKRADDAIRNHTSDEKAAIENLKQHSQKVAGLTANVKELISNYERFSGGNATELGGFAGGDWEQQITAAIESKYPGARIKSINHDLQEVTYELKTGARAFTEYTAGVRQADQKIMALKGTTKKLPTFLDGVKKKLGEISQYFSAMSLISRATQELRKGIQYVKEIDLALTELKKVTDETEETYNKFLDTASKTAAKVGSTIRDVVSSTADWARLGYSMEQAAKFAESTQILMNVSEFTDVSQATDTLISAIQAFGYAAETSMDVVDMLNMIGNNYAISTADLAQSLTKSSASLVAAGGNLAEAAALTATANAIIQDADSVGTALKTTSLRLRGTSIEILEEEGLDSDGAVTSTSKLRSKVQALSGVDILTATGEYKSTYEILSQIADVWSTINDMDQAALLELLAGKRNASVLAAILQSPEELKAAYEDANNAQGSALKENEKYLDSIQGKIDQLTNAVQTMWKNALDDDVVKFFVELLTNLVKILDTLGPIKTVIAGIMAYTTKKHGVDIFSLIPMNADKAKKKIAELKTEIAKLEGLTSQKSLQRKDALTQQLRTLEAQVAPSEELVSAQNKLQKAQDRLANTKSTNPETIKRYEREVNKAKLEVDNLTAAQNKAGKSGNIGFKNLGKSVKNFAKEAGKALIQMAAIYAIMKLLELAKEFIDYLIETPEEAAEKFEELTNELKNTKNELEGINDELKTLDDKIAELTAKGKLSFTEQEELERLRAERAELERELELKKALAQQQQEQVNLQTSDQVEYYKNKGVKTGKTTDENVGKAAGTAATAGGIATAAATMAAIGGTMSWNVVGWVLLAAAAVTGAVAGIAYAVAEGEEKIGESIDNMEANLAEKEDELREAREAYQKSGSDSDKKKYEEAQKALSDYRGEMSKYFTELGAYYDNVDLSDVEDPERYKELKKEMNDFYNERDKWLITSGSEGATSNAINRVFDKKENKKAKEEIESLMEQLKEDPGNTAIEQKIKDIINGSGTLKADFEAIGIELNDVARSFTQMAEDQLFGTVDGKIAELERATTAFKALLNGGQFNFEGKNIGLADLFNDEGEVIQTRLSEIFKNTSSETREAITGLLERSYDDIQNGTVKIETLLGEFAARGSEAILSILQETSDTFEEISENMDKIQDSYSTLSNAVEQYNSAGFLTLDNLQSLLSLEPEYLALLQMENGQLTINQAGYEALIQTKLAEAKASVVQSAMKQLNALAAKSEATATNEASTAAANSISNLGTYASALSDVAKNAIGAAGAVYAFNNAVAGAQANELVSQDEIDTIIESMNTQLLLIDSIGANLSTNFSGIMTGGEGGNPKDGGEDSDIWDNLLKKYQGYLDAITHQKDLIQAEIDKAEAQGFIASEKYYEDLIALEKDEQAVLIAKQRAMQDFYNANSASMSADEIDEWNAEMRETALAIKEAETNMIEFGNTIEDIKWEYFENVREDINNINEEIEFMHSLLEDAPVADENGNWSNEALTRLGLYTQQMEEAAYSAQDYQQKIDELNESTTDEEKNSDRYRDKLAELVDGQREAINSYEDAKDGIVELNEARIEAIKEGIEKEIEAMNDLLDVKREELDAERDLYDFKKNIEEQNKSIADTERKLAALSGSTAAEDIAERKRLEAELRKQQGDLDDTYYDHSMTAQQNALDEEGRYFEEAQQRRIESLEAMLENTEELIVNSMMDVMLNADTVHNTLNEQATTYGVTLSKELTKPWLDASAQAIAWRDELKRDMTEGEWASMIGEGGAITAFSNGVATKLGGSWDTAKTKAKAYSDFLTGTELKNNLSGAVTTFTTYLQKIVDKWDEIRKAANAATAVTPTVPSGGYTGGGDGNNGGKTENPPKQEPKKEEPKKTTTPTRQSTPTRPKFEKVGDMWSGVGHTGVNIGKKNYNKALEIEGNDAIYYPYTNGNGYQGYIRKGEGYTVLGNGKMDIHTFKPIYQKYAEGSLGITKDQWAITDEPQFGDELVLVPGKDGNLSFMRKGTGVVPADMTQKLFELAQIPTSDLMSKNVTAIVPNITKNEFKNEFNFDSLVHVDHCDQNTLKDLEKMVDNKINQFGKQMNYALKGIK